MKKKIMNEKTWRITKKILIGCGITLLSFIVIGVVFILIQIAKAPDISEIDATPNGYRTTILDRNENVMEILSVTESNRIYVELEDIPLNLQKAFIAIEDSRFYSHGGIDIKGIFRAFVHGISKGNFSQGASTITQQLLKNNVFTSWMEEETFYDRVCRKIQEQYLAVRLEQEYSKEWILENYLNTINLGGGTRGVQVAAQYYFGKDVSELSLAQCALIAGITKNPSAYNPVKNPEKSIERQHLVLDAMLKQEMISKEEYDQAMLENVISKLDAGSGSISTQIFSWFEDALLQQMIKDLTEEYTYTESEAWDLIYSGGLTIYSTQDTDLQSICEEEAKKTDWYTGGEEISIVMTDVSTGGVVAIIGGRGEKDSSLVYNRATDSIRQPGSTIKVLGEYAAALDTKELSLGSVLDDEPYCYSEGTSIHNSYGAYRGMTTVRDAIASSSNVVALKAYQLVGEDTVYEYLQKFGITTLTEADRNEALAIGGTYNGVTNLELTSAYNAIANLGTYVEPFFYTKVVDRNGKIILERGLQSEQIINKETAKLLTCAMEEVIASGTGKDAAVENLTLAGKSGTTNGNKDLWFIGFSGYYTCGIWGGYDNNSEQANGSYVKHIWQSIMEQSHDTKEDVQLVETESLTSVIICKKCGNLAVDDLCDDTVQGDMTQKEYFIAGTEPTEDCDCHIEFTTCSDSGKLPGSYCPKTAKVTDVYLQTASEGTEDERYVVPDGSEEVCDIHTDFWDQWWASDGNEGDKDGENDSDEQNYDDLEQEEESDDETNWLEDLYNSLFGT